MRAPLLARGDRYKLMSASPTGRMSAQAGETLGALLQRVFGFPSFRANQEAVCRAAIEGRDVLLVMPTGAGKSLCYQLPAVARGGTTLVVSPLIALMEDQVSKLAARGLSVSRIHSGLDRAVSRQACIDYLQGTLQFLFIAPERLRVPGFAAMLAKRKPSLIAIDEAHCISEWGHDFRPDYRMLGQHLPALRPAPVIALTATATPVVQNDIVAQLALRELARFIHGFRRDNLAIEVVEVPQGKRHEFVGELLRDPGRCPAIVYTPTRKDAEALAVELSSLFPAAAYHAGLDARRREDVQKRFLESRIEAIVATIAFGMGIDKPNVRTIIHTALPASLEAYYQEIGRAGRDGHLSRTILMHSYADRRRHDFFFERDYPALPVLDQIFRRLRAEPQQKNAVREALQMDSELFDKALEKLTIHGGAVLDFAGMTTRGHDAWRKSYATQFERRRSQVDVVIRYAEGTQCRMSALVRHFGDFGDGRRTCGHCDFCAPETCIAQRFRTATNLERQTIKEVLEALRKKQSMSTGKLHQELFPSAETNRNDFEELLGAMARAGVVQLEEAAFAKDGKSIPFTRVSLAKEGYVLERAMPLEFSLRDVIQAPAQGRRKKKSKGKWENGAITVAPVVGRQQSIAGPSVADLPTETGEQRKRRSVAASGDVAALVDKLRAWRLAEARKLRVPAFCIFGDATLHEIALNRPTTLEELLEIYGIGAVKVEKFGTAICRICQG
jgi:RecQ family ATP-dependent DNA helicase